MEAVTTVEIKSLSKQAVQAAQNTLIEALESGDESEMAAAIKVALAHLGVSVVDGVQAPKES